VTAYVMVSEGMDAELALKYVQMKHPPAWPNEGFRYQLKLFEGVHAMPWRALATFPLSGTSFRNHYMFPSPEALPACCTRSGLEHRPAELSRIFCVPLKTDMGCKLDPEYPPYKHFLLCTMTQQSFGGQAALPAPHVQDGEKLVQCLFCLGSKHHLCCYLPIAQVCEKREFQRFSIFDCVRGDVPAAHRMTVGSRAPICLRMHHNVLLAKPYRGCSQEAALPLSSCVHYQTLLCAQTVYRCRKCRSLLLTSANIVDAEAGPSESAGDWRSRYSGGDANGETQPGC